MKRFLPVVAIVALGLAACEQTPTEPSADGTAVATVSTLASMSARGSWNNWHVHDGGMGEVDETGLRHEGYEIWPVIFGDDYKTSPSLWVYCPDGIEGHGGSKPGSGTCQSSLYIIPVKLNASDAPAPRKWTALPLGGGLTLYYRLIPR